LIEINVRFSTSKKNRRRREDELFVTAAADVSRKKNPNEKN
jgi:hypothetical protein